MADSQDYWNQLYKSTPFPNGKGPLPYLTEMLPRLQKGKTLDIGSGSGSNSVYLATKGFEVTALDISESAIAAGRSLALETGVSVEFKEADLDFFMLGLMTYDTIIMTFFKPSVPRYYNELVRGLKQGGTLLVHSYMTDEQTEALGPEDAYKNYYYQTNELIRNLVGMQILHYSETMENGKHIVQCFARKPLDKDAAKYNLFNMSSKVEQKGGNKQQELAEALFKKKD
ncbi:MAG: methyltransferase domain-containing protein [Bdellovibrionota bacterium]